MDHEEIESKYLGLQKEFLEMGQIKSDFDMEKFTVKKYGPFPAHNYHMLCRQYSILLFEYHSKLVEKRHEERELWHYEKIEKEHGPLYRMEDGDKIKYVDLMIAQIRMKLQRIELSLKDDSQRLEFYEKCREKLVNINNGVPFTNEDYQKEEPEFLNWWLKTQAIQQIKSRNTGISEGVIRNISYLEEDFLVTPEYQLKVTNQLGLPEFSKFAGDPVNKIVPRPIPMEHQLAHNFPKGLI